MQMEMFEKHYHNFEGVWNVGEHGVEFIYARSLQKLLGYTRWEKFQNPIAKAKESCRNNSYHVDDHFHRVVKMVDTGSGARREVEDIQLTRYACYLIAMNGDPRKIEIAFAQNYFAVQTRKLERIIERINQVERIDSRRKLAESEKEFNRVIYERGVKDKDFGTIKSKGDRAFFGGKDTRDMKRELGVPEKRTLADYTDKAVNLGRALANTITTMNVEKEDLYGVKDISDEHVKSNKNVRKSLTDSGIYPEKMPPGEDIKKVRKKLAKEEKLIPKESKKD